MRANLVVIRLMFGVFATAAIIFATATGASAQQAAVAITVKGHQFQPALLFPIETHQIFNWPSGRACTFLTPVRPYYQPQVVVDCGALAVAGSRRLGLSSDSPYLLPD
jgi:hypothetical protein